MIRRLFLVSILCIVLSADVSAQLLYDSSITNTRRNIVRINPTPATIVGLESFAFGYERVIAEHQSLSLNIGSLKFRNFANLPVEQYGIEKNRTSGGFSIAIDYRRYFKKRNRGFAPDGLYWGPFFTYYYYYHELGLSYTDPASLSKTSVSLSGTFQVRHIGIQLGYQFIILKRLSIDLILLGPSFGKYVADFEAGGNLNIDQENELYQAFYELITDRVPGVAALLENKSLSKTGHFSTNNIGMRYVFQIGFLF